MLIVEGGGGGNDKTGSGMEGDCRITIPTVIVAVAETKVEVLYPSCGQDIMSSLLGR